jgi:hypothetical protein
MSVVLLLTRASVAWRCGIVIAAAALTFRTIPGLLTVTTFALTAGD